MPKAIGSCAVRATWDGEDRLRFLAALVTAAVLAQGNDPGPEQVRHLNNQILRIASDVRSATPSGISLLRGEAANLIEMRAAALNKQRTEPGKDAADELAGVQTH